MSSKQVKFTPEQKIIMAFMSTNYAEVEVGELNLPAACQYGSVFP